MAGSIITFLVILIIFLIFTEIVTIRFIKDSKLQIHINLMIFGLVLRDFTHKKPKENGRNIIKQIELQRELAKSIVSSSEIDVLFLSIKIPDDNPSEYAISRALIFAALGAILGYISTHSRKFNTNNIFCLPSDNNKIEIIYDIKLTISLLRIIQHFIVFFLKYLKAVGIKNVRQANE